MMVNGAKAANKLLVYIPTYNRISLLDKQLANLASQLDKNSFDISILVSNNASTDGDYKLLETKYEKYPITFSTNKNNIGGNANILLGFLYGGNYEYLWVLSDDDEITDHCLAAIFKNLDAEYPLIHIGTYEKEQIRTLKNEYSFFTITEGPGLGLISTVIYQTAYFSAYFINAFEYYDTSFPHMAILLGKLQLVQAIDFRCIKSKDVFTGNENPGISAGDYTSSYLGFCYLINFFPSDDRRRIMQEFIADNHHNMYRLRNSPKHSYKYKKMMGFILLSFPSLFAYFYYLNFKKILTDQVSVFVNRVKNKIGPKSS
jgi:glycosyltransferase involved in cell wall biosynthesis